MRILSLVGVLALAFLSAIAVPITRADELSPVEVEGQPLAANVARLAQALEFLGAPLPEQTDAALKQAGKARDARRIQQLLDAHVLLVATIDRDGRVQARRGPAPATLQQAGYTPVVVKVVNGPEAARTLYIHSPQGGPPYAGVADLSMKRQDQVYLKQNENKSGDKGRFLHLEMFGNQPMTPQLSGLKVEYAIALVYSSAAGKREARVAFDFGKGSSDVAVSFDIRPAVPVKLSIKDFDGKPTTGRFTFRDRARQIYPPQARRLAPDLFFQQHIYRHDGETVLLPPGEFIMAYSRGPEYRLLQRKITVPAKGDAAIEVKLERWINLMGYGYYCGDHHIHAAGCAHYSSPTEGVLARDMFRQVKGEGLNVGCILTWGPCYQFQQQFFAPTVNPLSEPLTLLKYDIEVSGFGSQALGHVCLLNLKKQEYPGSDGTKSWPTWTTPVLRWAKKQGAYTGYAHSASGLAIDAPAAAERLLAEMDRNRDGKLSREEAEKGLLPETFPAIDADGNGFLNQAELTASLHRAADRLPNLAIPELNSVGAQEIFVTSAQGLCDFISAMDTARIAEWNCWYHIMNCGFPLKVSGETDFPCMSGTRVGQGRVYVRLGKVDKIDFAAWCKGLAKGRSYVSDGYAHAPEFSVNGKHAGEEVGLEKLGEVTLRAKVAFAAETPAEVPYGVVPIGGPRLVGDTVNLHGPRAEEGRRLGGRRRVEIVVNGKVVATREVPADDKVHDLEFTLTIDRSSWVALRQFPQLHTNPVNVLVAGKPIRASRSSARWCAGCIEQLWRVRGKTIAAAEREEANQTFLKAVQVYRRIAAEAPEGS